MTPKDIVRLAVSMVFANDDELMKSDKGVVRTLYDQTYGTGGFIADALDMLDEWHENKKMTAPAVIVPYGEELSDVTWAMGKANLLLRNVSNTDGDVYDQMKDLSEHIILGDTLADDKYSGETFNYQLSNPPYGKKWEKQQADVLDEAKLGFSGRFGAGLPSISDGSMLFLQNMVSKLAPLSEGGGRGGIILSASPLYNGSAGSGPSNIRRWLFEKDYIDCIVKLPTDEFFRTGINTYLWILTNRKEENRKGMIQLIDASECRELRRKYLGNKRYDLSETQINWIVTTYINGHDGGKSVLIPKEEFMYREVTVQRPLRQAIIFDMNKFGLLFEIKAMEKLSEDNRKLLKAELSQYNGEQKTVDWLVSHAGDFRKAMVKPEVTLKPLRDALISVFSVKGEEYDIVRGPDGTPLPDPNLKDTEKVPYDLDIDDYMKKEVYPYVPDAWVDKSVVDSGPLSDGMVGIVGTQISFDKYFYHYEAPRNPQEIMAEIKALEPEIEDALKGVFE